DAITLGEIRDLAPQAIVLSPGPCTPQESGICLDAIRHFAPTIPMLGVCLGHQAIGEALGGRVVRANEPVHGRASRIVHHQQGIFANLDNPLVVGRYHSLVVSPDGLPGELEITATTPEGVVMALQHRSFRLFGVQFHPESILTHKGYELLANFLRIAGLPVDTSKVPCVEWSKPAPRETPQVGTPITF
ncbi:MAG: Aminodeoxychorismate/anthranilate synthase component 2, partial [Planctomycetota bacterium]